MGKPRGYADLGDLPENQRCRVIAAHAAAGEVVGFIVNHDEKVIERYIRKIKAHAPNLRIERLGVIHTGCFALKAYLGQQN